MTTLPGERKVRSPIVSTATRKLHHRGRRLLAPDVVHRQHDHVRESIVQEDAVARGGQEGSGV